MVGKGVSKIRFKPTKVGIVWVLLSKKSDAGSLQSFKLMLFDRDAVFRDVGVQMLPPFHMR